MHLRQRTVTRGWQLLHISQCGYQPWADVTHTPALWLRRAADVKESAYYDIKHSGK